ncbi:MULTISPECIES: acyl CoA:acetate/3-ketoacid CoA transferase [unclassified Caballeronia]|uniref:acyl CoA:acetate/3-ketoacid CoA transferase n=1 Tax=unclassified Caballeronia TaxID=2646786 RepID=UPI00286481A5|nr:MULTISPECIES: CoA-transferase [unclassified Caballeronia]MDR5774698.1 CoA-transferase [Caballeronia sp. LZ002]MDR5850134.1 CoA-transferase [Caballeronia sp. LZ003]
MDKWIHAEAVANAIPDGATIAITGSGGGLLEPDAVLAAIETRFLTTGHPCDLTVVHALGVGDGRGSGLGRFAHEGMVRRVIGGHWVWSPAMQQLAESGRIEAYSFPGGVIATLFREIGAKRPGVLTRVGLRTFVDPRFGGGKLNDQTHEDLVELVTLGGEEYLRYKPFRIDWAIVMASSADDSGNLTTRHEPADLDIYAVALAAHNSGGTVVAQVKTRSQDYVPARLVRVPGVMVDRIVETPAQRQCAISDYDAALSGEALLEAHSSNDEAAYPEGMRLIVAERAARELGVDQSVNFGFGFPGAIPAVLARQGRVNDYWGSVEQGVHRGVMLDGAMFGTARNADAILPSVDQFDFYSGGGIDVTFLGMGEFDEEGNVNVSKLGSTVVGPGGFMDIAQGAKKIVFCGAFEAKGLEVKQHADSLEIVTPGSVPKAVKRVRHVTFSGVQARLEGKEVLYVTERAVFRLDALGVRLIEVAKGIDVRRDVLARMAFEPLVDEHLLEAESAA